VQQRPERGVRVATLTDGAALVGAAAHGLWLGDPELVVPSRPVSQARMARLRRTLVGLALLLWSLALWFCFRLIHGL
jgi:hypothetical protein